MRVIGFFSGKASTSLAELVDMSLDNFEKKPKKLESWALSSAEASSGVVAAAGRFCLWS